MNQVPRNRSEQLVKKAFAANGIELTPALLDFELKFGGTTILIGKVRVEFGIIWGGGFPFNPELTTIEFEHNDLGDAEYLFECAKSDYPMYFAIDEKGRYYEDYELKFESFEEFLNTTQ